MSKWKRSNSLLSDSSLSSTMSYWEVRSNLTWSGIASIQSRHTTSNTSLPSKLQKRRTRIKRMIGSRSSQGWRGWIPNHDMLLPCIMGMSASTISMIDSSSKRTSLMTPSSLYRSSLRQKRITTILSQEGWTRSGKYIHWLIQGLSLFSKKKQRSLLRNRQKSIRSGSHLWWMGCSALLEATRTSQSGKYQPISTIALQ